MSALLPVAEALARILAGARPVEAEAVTALWPYTSQGVRPKANPASIPTSGSSVSMCIVARAPAVAASCRSTGSAVRVP